MGKIHDRINSRQRTLMTDKPTHVTSDPTAKIYSNVVFLDLEGPIVSHRTIMANSDRANKRVYHGQAAGWQSWVDHTAISLVARLCMDYDAQVCLTSVLRTDPGICSHVYSLLYDQAEKFNYTKDMYCGETSKLREREQEIRAFISKHGVERYVVIDDRELVIDNFIYVDQREGFTYENFIESRKFLHPNPSELTYPVICL